MTRYTVLWDSQIEAEFVRLWVDSDSTMRAALTEVARSIDRNLALDPENKGLWRADLGVRVLVVPAADKKCSVVFQVLPEDRQVRVLRLTVHTSGDVSGE